MGNCFDGSYSHHFTAASPCQTRLPLTSALGQEVISPFLIGCLIRDLLQKELIRWTVRRSSAFRPLLPPAKLMIISYQDKVFREPGFGTKRTIYQPVQDIQSSQSPIQLSSSITFIYIYIYMLPRTDIFFHCPLFFRSAFLQKGSLDLLTCSSGYGVIFI
jgi:hypothetical protein